MQRKFPVLGQVRDVDGSLWYVRDVRTTKHGFDLLFGSPDSHLGIHATGLPRLIATQPLTDFWEANQTCHDGVLFDLPAGRTTLKRVRYRLGFNYHKDTARFWKERMGDLKTLSAREFAAKHDVPLHILSDMRQKLLGRRARELGWWREPTLLKVLDAKIPLREVAEKLGISISHAKRIRDQHRASAVAEAA